MEKLIKSLILFSGAFCLFILIVTRLEHMPDFIADTEIIKEEKSGVYGDLYFLCMLDYFKIRLPEYYPSFTNSDKLKEINSADIIVIGDSFLRMTRIEKNFLQFLADSLRLNVYFKQEFNIFDVLQEDNYKKSNPKIILCEIVERHIVDLFKKRHIKKNVIRRGLTDLMRFVIPYDREIYYQFVLQKSIFTSKLYNTVANLRFNLFKEISETVPVYGMDPPWLFLYKDVNKKFTSFYNIYSDDEIDNLAVNIKKLSDDLKSEYNLDFIFFPVPNKYSLYSGKVNNDEYNMFIPRLYSALEKNGVKTIKIFDEFKNSDNDLYYPTDTHWNPEGNKMVVKLFLEQMRKYNYTF